MVTHPPLSPKPLDFGGASSPIGLTPNQVRGAYGLGTYSSSGVLTNPVTFGGIVGDGSGQTIAIVDAYDDPNAISDLNAFSAYFGLPVFGGQGGPTFQQLDQYGGNSLPGTDPAGPGDSWVGEESLDIEWAHTMAPMANIILFEASDPSDNNLYTAVQTAANTPGVVAVSMSWGQGEFAGETKYDSAYFVTPKGHVGGAASLGSTGLPGGVTFLASAGDSGAYDSWYTDTITPQYPASSPNVVAVGGTSLTVNADDTYGSEITWGNGTDSGIEGGGGGGISVYESQPPYQHGVVTAYSTRARTYPDVSAEADPDTGVPIYDSWDFGTSTPWSPGPIGGTSLACPLWAGVIAVADQGARLRAWARLMVRPRPCPISIRRTNTPQKISTISRRETALPDRLMLPVRDMTWPPAWAAPSEICSYRDWPELRLRSQASVRQQGPPGVGRQ